MTKTVKRLSVIVFAGLAGLCAFFALLTFRPLTQAKAETLITVTVYDGNNLNEIDSKQVDVTDGAKQFPKALVNSITSYFGEDLSNIYGASAVSTNTETKESVTSWGSLDEVKGILISKDNIEVYVYTKSDVKIKLLEGSTVRGTLTVPYTKNIKDVTLDDLNAVSGVPKSGYILKSFTPNGTDSTFPKAGVRSLSLEYGKETAVVFKNEDGSKTLLTKNLAAGSIYDTRYDNEIQAAAKKEGYTLKGWRGSLSSDLVINKIPIDTSDMVLYAVYEENSENLVTITFKDGETVLYTAEIEKGDALTFADYPELEEKTKKAGYVFKGWLSEGGTLIEAGSLRTLNAYKDMTYTAVYESTGISRYAVYFYVDGLERASHTAKLGVDIIFSDYADVLALQEKDGYNFKGWRKKGDEDGELLTDKYAYQVGDEENDVILEAVFEKQSFIEKNFGKLGISTGGLVICGIAVYLLFFRKTRRR